MISQGKLESLMVTVGCSFGKWRRSLSEHSGFLRILALLQFLRTGEFFPAACSLTIQLVFFIETICRIFGSWSFGGHFKPQMWANSWAACWGCRDEEGSGPDTKERALSRLSLSVPWLSHSLSCPSVCTPELSSSSIYCPQRARGISEIQIQFSVFRGFILLLG